MQVNQFFSELKQFFTNSFADPVYQEGGLYFIIEELLNPRNSGLIKILCGRAKIGLEEVTLDEAGIPITNQLIVLHDANTRKCPH